MNEKLKRFASLPYRFECRFDPKDKVYVVRYPELRGCVAHGKTVAEAIARGAKFKREWLETALEAGYHVPEPQPESEHSGKLLVRLPISVHSEVAREAEEEQVSLNAYIVQAVTEKLQRSGMRTMALDLYNHLLRRPGKVFVAWGNQDAPSVGEDEVGRLLKEPAESKPTDA